MKVIVKSGTFISLHMSKQEQNELLNKGKLPLLVQFELNTHFDKRQRLGWF